MMTKSMCTKIYANLDNLNIKNIGVPKIAEYQISLHGNIWHS